MQQTVGLVGVGIMGRRMGRNLIRAGFPLVAFDVNAARAAGLGPRDQGAVARELERLAGIHLGTLTPGA